MISDYSPHLSRRKAKSERIEKENELSDEWMNKNKSIDQHQPGIQFGDWEQR